VLFEATSGISDVITIPGIINVDFADVRRVMNQSGEALIGVGTASGENRTIEAAQKAISSPLLEGVSIKGAKNILLNITGSSKITMQEIEEGNKVIYEAAGGDEADIIFGWVMKDDMDDEVTYTVIATGFDKQKSQAVPQPKVVQSNANPITLGTSFESGFKINPVKAKNEDLNVPTFIRVTGNKPVIEDVEPKVKGFASGYNYNNNNSNNINYNEDDSSEFLRMMMD